MSDLCPPLIPSGIERVGARAHVPAACTGRNGEKLSRTLSISRVGLDPDSARAKSIFAVRRSIIDNGQINGVKMCPGRRARRLLQCISRIAYFSRPRASSPPLRRVVSIRATFPTWQSSRRRVYSKLLPCYGSKANSMTAE